MWQLIWQAWLVANYTFRSQIPLLEQTRSFVAAPESPDDPAQVGERDGDAHEEREGGHQVHLIHGDGRRWVVAVEVEPEADIGVSVLDQFWVGPNSVYR